MHAVLATAVLNILHPITRRKILVRALVDQGSEVTLIRSRVQQLLSLPYGKANIKVSGVFGGDNRRITKKAVFVITPHFGSNFSTTIEALVANDFVKYEGDSTGRDLFKELLLADLDGSEDMGPYDLLIGSDYIARILEAGMKTKGDMVAQKTKLGWITSGRVMQTANAYSVSINTSLIEIENNMKSMFEVEENVTEDEQAEALYEETTTRNPDGRYVVRLPFKESVGKISTNREMARARFMNVERRFLEDASLKEHYDAFMKEYLDMGHMEETKLHDGVFLPHHVITKDSATTPYRVVFDASAKGKNGLSLNDFLIKGPKLQEDLSQILLRWRTYRFVFTADVEKMFRQILIHPEDQRNQLIY